MSIKTRTIQNGRIAIIELRGALVDDDDTDALRMAAADLIEQGNKCLVIIMSKVNYLNSSGVGTIISVHTSYSKNGGEVRLAGLTSPVQNVLTITRLIDVFEVFDNLDEAIADFDQKKSLTS
jgi:anti-sigma B factor antagonist